MSKDITRVGMNWIIDEKTVLKRVKDGDIVKYVVSVEKKTDGGYVYYDNVPNGVMKAATKKWEGGINVDVE